MVESDTISTRNGDIVIQPINHASLVLTFGDTVVYLDPVGELARYQALKRPDLILITHHHSDHFSPETLAGLMTPATRIIGARTATELLPAELKSRATTIGENDQSSFDGIGIRTVPAHNLSPERMQFHPPGTGVGFILSFDDTNIYVSGDTEAVPEMLGLRDIDVAFLPMDGHYTMDGIQAAEAAKAFRPEVVYPFHYGQGGQPPVFAEQLAGEKDIAVRLRDWYAQ